jgi:hypothetical protein
MCERRTKIFDNKIFDIAISAFLAFLCGKIAILAFKICEHLKQRNNFLYSFFFRHLVHGKNRS